MSDMMMFPDSVEEFMNQYKVVDTEQVYTNGVELVPIFRMKQWFEHLPSAQPDPQECEKCIFKPFKQFQPAQRTGRWIPLCEKWPDKYGNYLVSTSRGYVVEDYYASYGWDDDSDKDYVVAWMPLPEPYKEGE